MGISMEEVEVERSTATSIILCIVFLCLSVASLVANCSVIISAIFERWKEVDNFTFVFFVSLSFNQLFIGLLILPMLSYAMVAHEWGLGRLFCWWCALLSTYLYTVYIVHAIVLIFDIVIVRYSDLRTMISVSLSKRIALNTWLICMAPQIYPLLSIQTPYLYDPIRGGCFQNFIYRDWTMLCKSFGMFIVLPLSTISVLYFVLLVKEENNRRLTATILKKQAYDAQRIITRNYLSPMITVVIFIATSAPLCSLGLLKLSSPTRIIPEKFGELCNTWMCFSGVLYPLLFLLTCKTYRICLFPKWKWDPNVSVSKLMREKGAHSPYVRRQGMVMQHNANMNMKPIVEDGPPNLVLGANGRYEVGPKTSNQFLDVGTYVI